jgi:hypothetical protein
MKLNKVVATVIPAREDYVGQVEEGQFLFEDGIVTLVSHAGAPLKDQQGKKYSKKLTPGEDAYRIAARLTKQLWQSRREKKRFSGPITYSKLSY